MKKLCTLLFITVLLTSCSSNNDDVDTGLDGTYSGTFTVVYTNGPTHTNTVTVNFITNTTYVCSGDGNIGSIYPAGGSGTFVVNGDKINFTDGNTWIANFDWNLILNGEYDFTQNGNNLTISADRANIGSYTYELVKQ